MKPYRGRDAGVLALLLAAPAALLAQATPPAADRPPELRPFALDIAQLVARRDSFAVYVQGAVLGYMVADVACLADTVRYVEDVALPAVAYWQHTVVAMDPASLAPRSLEQTGRVAGQALAIHLVYVHGRVRGEAQTPDLRAGAPRRTPVDTTVAEDVIDANAVRPLVLTLPLAGGAAWEVPAFDAAHDAELLLRVSVAGGDTVSVPAGRFPAFRVDVTGGPEPYVLYVGTETPHRLLKMEVTGQPLSFDLIGPHPPTPAPR